MTDTYKRLNTTRAFSSGTALTIYTVPAATVTLVKKITVSNNAGATATAKIHHVQSGGSADATNVILPTTSLATNEHGVDDAPFAMATGDFIAVVGDGTNVVNISIYGLEVS